MYIVVGLGNPGEEYAHTRHNVGKMTAEFASTKVKVGAKFIFLETFMNKSGSAVSKFVKNKASAKKLIIIHDDMDLPLGTTRISYNRGSGGHRGVESIIRALKTKDFTRLRIGISPATPSGKLKKPKGEKAVLDFILGKFKPSEELVFKKICKTSSEIIETIISEGREMAANKFN